jgi:2-succinyl-5-enolpyruvyl-6-hydroxy-3-cyclohexene-1-carboxylate synthase
MTTPGEANLTIACAFVDEIAARGVRHVVICPGSHSTPLAVALSAHEAITAWVLVDERSAAFFALGMARQLAQPVALLCTSGTAAANFHPAVIEADLGRTPLLVLTADRPPELRGWGAAQAIDQVGLYGNHVKWFADMPVPVDDDALVRHARVTASRAVDLASRAPAGPVHLNFPFREPLLPVELRPPLMLDERYRRGCTKHIAESSSPAVLVPEMATLTTLTELIAGTPRGLIVCGPIERDGLGCAAGALAAATGYPILADPLSNVRFGPHERSHVIDAYDAFLRPPELSAALAPELVLRVGAIPTSKPLQQHLAAHPGHHHILVDPGEPRDPSHLATDHLRLDPAATFATVAQQLGSVGMSFRGERGISAPHHRSCEPAEIPRKLGMTPGAGCPNRSRANASDLLWLARWCEADQVARGVMRGALDGQTTLFEGKALAEVAAALPDGATLVVGNSMPVRDADTFLAGDERRLRIVANRGANGIDGVVSSALGAAAVADGPVALVIGDLSFYHDLNGLLAARLHAIDATIVVLNNDGGGIFSFLPQAEQLETETFERLFGTPAGIDVAAVARLYGASYARPLTWDAFRAQLRAAITCPGLSILELRTDRNENVSQHRAVTNAVAAAMRDLVRGWA